MDEGAARYVEGWVGDPEVMLAYVHQQSSDPINMVMNVFGRVLWRCDALAIGWRCAVLGECDLHEIDRRAGLSAIGVKEIAS